MKHIKSERLKKFELELNDLEQWLKLGLVPKKDIDKHKEEIVSIKAKIEEEKERLQSLKESGEAEEYILPKRTHNRAGYNEMPTIPDIDLGGETMSTTDTGFEMETDGTEADSSTMEERDDDADSSDTESDEEGEENEEDESYFSDRNRWRRGGIIDPDANDW